MAGGGVHLNVIQPTELESWGRISGTEPTSWELMMLHRMDVAYVAAMTSKDSKGGGNKHQALGEYCQGAEVESCRAMFGEGLERVCGTCPN